MFLRVPEDPHAANSMQAGSTVMASSLPSPQQVEAAQRLQTQIAGLLGVALSVDAELEETLATLTVAVDTDRDVDVKTQLESVLGRIERSGRRAATARAAALELTLDLPE